jgi:hypothetical protein
VRTPNTSCVLCGKLLYRRPFEFKKTRYFACMGCRTNAQRAAGVTVAQQTGLSLGRIKGTNHRAGYSHREESKAKAAEANRAFWDAHPEKLKERGEKLRGERHYRWRGGANSFNLSIRQMEENRRWMLAVRERDGQCLQCGARENLESHHKTELAKLIERFGIKSRDDARTCVALWDISNGETLCQLCHYAEHGRISRAAIG